MNQILSQTSPTAYIINPVIGHPVKIDHSHGSPVHSSGSVSLQSQKSTSISAQSQMNYYTKLTAEFRRKNFSKKSSLSNSGPRSPPPTMNSAYPNDLAPTDHPILSDHRPRSQDCGAATCENPRRSKGHQPLSRYHTLPITFEEISEIDEELYLKQHAKDEPPEDHQRDPTHLRRTSSFGSSTSPRTCSRKSNFESQGPRKTRSYSVGAILFSPSSSPTCGSRTTKQRSQESLVQLGLSTLPTIPEDSSQQQAQMCGDPFLEEPLKHANQLQRSLSAEGSRESQREIII